MNGLPLDLLALLDVTCDVEANLPNITVIEYPDGSVHFVEEDVRFLPHWLAPARSELPEEVSGSLGNRDVV